MIQIAVVSGKGGTGKTTLSASFAFLFDSEKLVMSDCDVDAPNLHLILDPEIREVHEYVGSKKAQIDTQKCVMCDVCRQVCRFDAIYFTDHYFVDKYACEGCNACVISCPVGAIELVDEKSGEYFLSTSRSIGAPMVHALLDPGEETSGGLIAEVRKLAINTAKEEKREVIVIDGAPGVGCSASSSITGVTYVVIVTEPTMSGLHDLKRIVELTRQFRRNFGVVINKYDINPGKTKEIEEYCEKDGIEVIGRIPFDPDVVKANVRGRAVVEFSDGPASKAIREIFENVKGKLL